MTNLPQRCAQVFRILRKSRAPARSDRPLVRRCRQLLDVLQRHRSLRLPPPTIPPRLPSAPPLLLLPAPKRPRRTRQRLSEETGEFCFKGDILDQLDLYQTYARRLKRLDSDAFGLYSKLGATIIPYSTMGERRESKVSPWFRDNLPGFGCIGISLYREVQDEAVKEGKVNSQFIYFTKYETPPSEVQRVGHHLPIYVVSVMWDRAGDPLLKHGVLAQFAVSVAPDGEVEVLRVRHIETQVVHHHDRRGRGSSYVTHQRWGIPEYLKEWAGEHKQEPREFLRHIFLTCTEFHERGNSSMIRVTARKNNVTAAFAVNVLRTPQFFADRDVQVNDKGNKKRIFHIVGVHKRTLRNGRTVAVRMGFRGLRKFRWNGYDIAISVPEKHHPDIAGNPLAFHDDDDPKKNYRDMSHLGDTMHAYIYDSADAAIAIFEQEPDKT